MYGLLQSNLTLATYGNRYEYRAWSHDDERTACYVAASNLYLFGASGNENDDACENA